MDTCTGCHDNLSEGPFHMTFDAIYPQGPLVLLCQPCTLEIYPDALVT